MFGIRNKSKIVQLEADKRELRLQLEVERLQTRSADERAKLIALTAINKFLTNNHRELVVIISEYAKAGTQLKK